MTIFEARKYIVDNLTDIYERDEASNIAELIIEDVSGLKRADYLLKKDESLNEKQENLVSDYTERLKKHEPVQYVLKRAWFAGQKFYVDENVLIPRPETEELVEWIIKSGIRNPTSKILDIGTGSGCIAIALKQKLPAAEVWACDISNDALNVARLNADKLHAAIDFVPLDFLDPGQRIQLPSVDIIVSNPPYVPERDKESMRKNVLDFEPAKALFVPDNDALVFYKAIAAFGKEKLHEKGKVFVEIHEGLASDVKKVFADAGYSEIEIRQDMQGKERMIMVLN